MLAMKLPKSTWLSHDTVTSRWYSWWVYGEWTKFWHQSRANSLIVYPTNEPERINVDWTCGLHWKGTFFNQKVWRWNIIETPAIDSAARDATLLRIPWFTFGALNSYTVICGNFLAILWLWYKPLWVERHKIYDIWKVLFGWYICNCVAPIGAGQTKRIISICFRTGIIRTGGWIVWAVSQMNNKFMSLCVEEAISFPIMIFNFLFHMTYQLLP